MEEVLASTVEVGAGASTPGSGLVSIQGSGDGAVAATSIRAIEAADMVAMEAAMVVTVASATMASATVVDVLIAVDTVAGEVAVGGQTMVVHTIIRRRRSQTPWVEAILPNCRATWEGNPTSQTRRPSRGAQLHPFPNPAIQEGHTPPPNPASQGAGRRWRPWRS